MRERIYWFRLLMIGALILGGCAAGGMKDVEDPGFLVDYSELTPGGEGRATLLYIKKGADFKKYNAIMFDRISIWLSPEAENRDIDPAVFKEMSDYFQKALVNAVKGDYAIVDQPGQTVLRVRAAITDVKPSSPTTDTPAAIGDTLDTGEAAAEMEFLDSMNSDRLVAAVDRRQVDRSDSHGEWEETKAVFDYWAERFRKALDGLRE